MNRVTIRWAASHLVAGSSIGRWRKEKGKERDVGPVQPSDGGVFIERAVVVNSRFSKQEQKGETTNICPPRQGGGGQGVRPSTHIGD